MTDFYSLEEGYIDDGMVIGFAKCIGSVTLHYTVHTTMPAVAAPASGLYVQMANADAEGFGIALKTGVTGDVIPVCLYGVVKLKAAAAIAEGDVVENDATSNLMIPIQTIGASDMTAYRGLNYTGTRIRLGYALQAGAVSGDDFLCLVGRVS